jgi:hypothetical protein
MSDFTVRSEHVDVEKIMHRIRRRIQEKRGVDYSDQEVRELANVKLERFLDPKNIRSDLVSEYRRSHPPVPYPDNIGVDHLFGSGRNRMLHLLRRLLNPILRLFMNTGLLDAALAQQRRINEFDAARYQRRLELDALNFEVLHNLVVEMTRLSIETKNLKMRLESLSTRLDFDERRARSLESLVQYRPDAFGPTEPVGGDEAAAEETADDGSGTAATEESTRVGRRRRRRRGRRRPGEGVPGQGGPGPSGASDTAEATQEAGGDGDEGGDERAAADDTPASHDPSDGTPPGAEDTRRAETAPSPEAAARPAHPSTDAASPGERADAGPPAPSPAERPDADR